MSYEKAMKHARNPKKATHMHLGFNVIGNEERRRYPWLGSAWFIEGMEQEREQFIKEYQEETERLLKENPNLVLVD